MKKDGLSVGVLKHTPHEISPDISGKDTDRFYNAGADFVFGHDPAQGFARIPGALLSLPQALEHFPGGLDLILVEGHKGSGVPAFWLYQGAPAVPSPQDTAGAKSAVSREDPKYIDKFLAFVRSEIEDFHSRRLVRAGLLVGGKSSRMGSPKALLEVDGVSFVSRSLELLGEITAGAVLLGKCVLPTDLKDADRLPDVPGVMGPMAGMLAAFRWDPCAAWVISAVDMPLMGREAWAWLLGQRRPGVWAVMPRKGAKVEATGACYEPMIFRHIEALASQGEFRLQRIAEHPKVITPEIPAGISHAWRNVNTPEDWRDITSRS